MTVEYGMSRETMDALNDFSCKVETLRYSISVLCSLIWDGAMEGNEEAGEQAVYLSQTLLEIVTIRDKQISEIIGQIRPVDKKGGVA